MLGLRDMVNVNLALRSVWSATPGTCLGPPIGTEREDPDRGNVVRAVRGGLALWDDRELQEFWIAGH